MTFELVAHRGNSRRFPENSLAALADALNAGARYLEFDIQISADGTPALFHDATLERMAGARGRIMDWSWEEIDQLRIRSPHGGESTTIPSFAAVVDWLATDTEAFSFVEMKRESISHFGRSYCLERISPLLEKLTGRCALISFDRELLELARFRGGPPVGWILSSYDGAHRERAEFLAPEFLFVDGRKFPSGRIQAWPGPWRWAVYTVNSLAAARVWAEHGFHFVETDCVSELIVDLETETGKGERGA